MAALNHYCHKSVSNKLPLKIIDIRIFTCLMHGFASKVNIYITYCYLMFINFNVIKKMYFLSHYSFEFSIFNY